MTRGMTLVELLLALSLLSALFLASAWWLREGADIRAAAEPALRWETSAHALLQRIHDDVVTGDFARTQRKPHVEVTAPNVLRVRARKTTRSEREDVHEYAFSRARSAVLRRRRLAPDVALLQDVREFGCGIDAETNILTVRIRSADGRQAARRYALP